MPLPPDREKDINAQFDPMRRRAAKLEAANLKQDTDTLDRTNARMGGAPGGAMIKQQMLATDRSAQRLNDVNEGLDSAAAGQRFQAGEAQVGREFQTSERLGSQKFATGERLGQQAYGTSERLSGQKFLTGERLGQQQYATGERLGSQEWQGGQLQTQIKAQSDLAAMQRRLDKDLAVAGMTGTYNGQDTLQKKAMDMTESQFREETDFNKKMAGIDAFLKASGSGLSAAQVGELFKMNGIDLPFIPSMTGDMPAAPAPAPAATPSSRPTGVRHR